MRDLSGNIYGKWKVLGKDDYKRDYWICQCSCDKKTIKSIYGSSLVSGGSSSCGCLKKYNIFIEIGNYYYVISSNNVGFLIDKEDYDLVLNHYWYVGAKGYVVTGDNKYRIHRLVMGSPMKSILIDHIDGNKLNNTKNNLRECTQQQNNCNTGIKSNNTSGASGVYLHKRSGKWIAHIAFKGERVHLGYFTSFDEAVKVRKEAEIKYFGKFRYVGVK